MTESEYQATISAERVFGRIQVHQKFRDLARDLGLPDDCSLPATVRRRLPRWYVDRERFAEDARRADLMTVHAQFRIGLAVQRPASDIVVVNVA